MNSNVVGEVHEWPRCSEIQNTAVRSGWEDASYVADLEFAARIGKILLEQNKELEQHSRMLEDKIDEQDAKITHLEKQLNVLRDLEDHRCKVYDQLQTSCQEFEAENIQLIKRHQSATEQIKRLKMLSDEQDFQLNNLTQELTILKVSTSLSPKMNEAQIPVKRKRSTSLPSTKKDYYSMGEQTVPISMMDNKVDRLSAELNQEKSRNNRLRHDLEAVIYNYEKTKTELKQKHEQRVELVKLSRVQSEKIKQLEEESLYQRSTTLDQIPSINVDLMNDLNEKYGHLKMKYDEIVNQMNETKKMRLRTPEYNDIFRRMFEVLSNTIDRKSPTREIIRRKRIEEYRTCSNCIASESRPEVVEHGFSNERKTGVLSDMHADMLTNAPETELPNSNAALSESVLD